MQGEVAVVVSLAVKIDARGVDVCMFVLAVVVQHAYPRAVVSR